MPRVITLPPPYANMPVHLTDVGQLIDLNSSAPQLVDLLFEELNLSPDQRQRFRQWRRTGSRVLRVTDLFRILEISPSDAPEIFHLATVHSGRVGISEPEIDDAIYNFTRRLPAALQTPPTGNTFVVSLARNSGYLGVVRLTSQGRGIVLEAE